VSRSGIGILGFAMFAAQQFAQVPGVALRCIAGTRREASLACAARFGLADAKMTVYGDLLRAMLTDQLAFIAEPSHTRVITEDNGRESLRMSVQATQLAMS
jgi:hypothetical protein